MKVISYSRVSTNEQANHGVSLNAQQSKIVGYAGVYDLTIVETIVDAGESAKSLKRPGIQRTLTMLRNGDARVDSRKAGSTDAQHQRLANAG